MALPRLGQYQLALQHPATAFRDTELRAARIETTPMGLPRVISGGFALTYHLTSGTREWAVRCFHREASGLGRRYQAIGAAVLRAGGPFVPVEYLADGVQVEGQRYPITKMPWLAAAPLNRYVESHLDSAALTRLAAAFSGLMRRLASLGIAHGDLQHGNILVDASGNLLLVDYDGMYVPDLAGMAANESGHVNYQHPGRAGQFDAELDRFSAIVVSVALQALAAEPSLWQRHNNGDNLLFRRTDFLDPPGSALFRELRTIPAVRTHVERLETVCQGRYDDVPALDRFFAGGVRPAVRVATAARRRASTIPARRTQFEVVAATDVHGLVRREGDVATIVGRVTALQRGLTRFGKPYLFLSFGSYRGGAFTLVLWSQTLDEFARSGRPAEAHKDQWVSITGLITVYRSRRQRRPERPQVVVDVPSEIRVLTAEDARVLLAGAAPATLAATPAPLLGGPLVKAAAGTLRRLIAGSTKPRPRAARRAQRRGGRLTGVRGRRGAAARGRRSRTSGLGRLTTATFGRGGRSRLLALVLALAAVVGGVAYAAPHLLGAALALLLGGVALGLHVWSGRP